MKFAYTIAPGRGETNLLLADVAGVMTSAGLRVCGTVQIDTDREKVHHCDMDVQVLPDGPLIRISQSLGTLSRGCRLNTDALEQAVALIEQGLTDGADILAWCGQVTATQGLSRIVTQPLQAREKA